MYISCIYWSAMLYVHVYKRLFLRLSVGFRLSLRRRPIAVTKKDPELKRNV